MGQKWVFRTGEQQRSSKHDRRAANKPFPCSGTAHEPEKGAQASKLARFDSWASLLQLLLTLQTPVQKVSHRSSSSDSTYESIALPKSCESSMEHGEGGRHGLPAIDS